MRVVGALVVLAAALVAQGQSERPQFRTGVELIQLDVVVLDSDRKPVSGLTESDFTVLDDGKPTTIRAFTPVKLAAPRQASEAVWASETPPDVVTNQIGEQEGRLVIILLDRSILVANIPAAKKIASAAIESLGPHDLGAVVSTANGVVRNSTVQNLTADHARLLRAINFSNPSTDIGLDAKVIMDKAGGLDVLTDGRCLCGICVHQAIQRVAEAVQDLPRRRKMLIFIGSDVVWQVASNQIRDRTTPPCEIQLKDARNAMFAAVDRASLTVHSIDPKGLVNTGPQTTSQVPGGMGDGPLARLKQQEQATRETMTGRQNLEVLPARTGGRTVASRNDPEQIVPDIFRESESYYLLGIERAASTRPDGSRMIEVTVRRKGLRVYTQRQYGPPSVETPPSDAPTGTVFSAAATRAISSLLPNASMPLSLAVVPFANAEGTKALVRVNVDAGAFAHADGSATPLDVSVVAVDRSGRAVAVARQTSTIAALPSPSGAVREVILQSQIALFPGDYGVRVAIADPASGKTASVFTDATVPNFNQAPLSVSGVSVEIADGSSAPLATTRRTFSRGEQVRAVTQIYQGTQRNEAIAPVSMRVRILDAKGQMVRDVSLPFAETAFTNRRADCVITLPLSSLAAGEYLLKLEASAGRVTSGRALRFEIQP